ncbi:MAG: hypothetical protein EBU01_16845, partial [Crocinitomicaceae bacterium]|nr:hypothetical protein [Crocinitomicaceae bacterium]
FRLSQNGEKKIKLTTSRFIFEAGGEITIVLVQEFPCANKMELDRRERFHIETNDCVNKNLPARTHDDLLKWKKEYNEANKEQLSQKRKEYAEENKELVAEQCKRYCKRHYQKKKEVILQKRKERVICDICQIEVGRHSLTRHKKRKHSTKN